MTSPMTPNKSDSGELRKILVKFGKRPFQFPGVDGPVRLVATDAEIDEALREITAHIQAVGMYVISCEYCNNNGWIRVYESGDKYADSQTEPCDECQEARQRLAQYLGEKQDE